MTGQSNTILDGWEGRSRWNVTAAYENSRVWIRSQRYNKDAKND